MARFIAKAEGRGAAVTRLGSTNHPAEAAAQNWEVGATAQAYAPNPDSGDRFRLGLANVCQGCSKGHSGGSMVTLWDGTEKDAQDLLGQNGPQAQAAAMRKAARDLQAKAREVIAQAAARVDKLFAEA